MDVVTTDKHTERSSEIARSNIYVHYKRHSYS